MQHTGNENENSGPDVNARGSSGVRRIFSEKVASTYEIVNHILTFGNDIRWRRKAARMAAARGGSVWVDLCTGTGETAAYLLRLAPPDTSVIAVDFSREMLTVAAETGHLPSDRLIEADVSRLPFADNSVDVITISFATRNINLSRERLIDTFREFHRILKPGGTFINLETSQPSLAIVRLFFHLYIRAFVRAIGGLISGSSPAYAYLSHTIPRFYNAQTLREILLESGFARVDFKRLMLGAGAIHTCTKD